MQNVANVRLVRNTGIIQTDRTRERLTEASLPLRETIHAEGWHGSISLLLSDTGSRHLRDPQLSVVFRDWPHCRLHRPRVDRIRENIPVTPSA